jgi:lipopolysaccharide export system protein LptA
VFRYRSEQGVVRYEGEARLEQGEMALTAEEVEVGLKKPGSEVEYLKARRRAFYDGPDFQAEGELIDYRKDERLVRVEGGRRPARAVRGEGNMATGAVLELDLDSEGIRIERPHGGRTRGMSTLSTSVEPQE